MFLLLHQFPDLSMLFWKDYKWSYAIYNNMDGPRDYHRNYQWIISEIIISEMSERERQIPYDITYMWNLKYDTNEPIYKTETDS